jgi:hypothetical protein
MSSNSRQNHPNSIFKKRLSDRDQNSTSAKTAACASNRKTGNPRGELRHIFFGRAAGNK